MHSPYIAKEHQMELVAGSLNVEVDEYLHAGYLSAYPRTFKDMAVHNLEYAETNVIDVKADLQLKSTDGQPGEPTHQTTAEVPGGPSPLAPASMGSETFLLATLFFFFAYLISRYYRRIRKVKKPGWRPWLLAMMPLLVIVVVAYYAFPVYEERRLNSLPPPWTGVPVKDYENSEAATKAILHALVANALPGSEVNVKDLAAIQHEVAFPVPRDEYTPGMSYAEKTYGRDGWGREFRFDPIANGRYRIASAGADGAHGTPDDIVLVTAKKDADNWEQLVNGVYVRRMPGAEDAYVCLIHQVAHAKFRWENSLMARQLTESGSFDMFTSDELFNAYGRSSEPKEQHPVLAQLKEYQEAQPLEERSNPLFFVQIATTEDG